jgi:hypothetical protein
MTRRVLLLASLVACLRADSGRDVIDVITDAVSGLSAGKAEVFLDAFDTRMADYAKFRDAVAGLVSQADLQSSIEVTANEGDDAARTVELNWILRIDRRDGATGSIRRQQTVRCRFEKTGKKWRIEEIEPRGFFSPPE